MAQWLKKNAHSNTGGPGSIPGQGTTPHTKDPHTAMTVEDSTCCTQGLKQPKQKQQKPTNTQKSQIGNESKGFFSCLASNFTIDIHLCMNFLHTKHRNICKGELATYTLHHVRFRPCKTVSPSIILSLGPPARWVEQQDSTISA